VKGDARSVSIAAASIVAKVARDKVMAELDAASRAMAGRRMRAIPRRPIAMRSNIWG
jgi:ribonuclease HII